MRLFVAIELPEEVRVGLAGLLERLPCAGVRWVARERWHVTCKFLGEVEERRLSEVTGALARATEGVGRFVWECRGCGGFPDLVRPRVLWAGVGRGSERMIETARVIESELAGAGFPPEARPFHPHVTLGRAAGRVPPRLLERLDRERETLFGAGEAGRVVLVMSVLGRPGPAYSVAGAWPLGESL